MVVTINVVTEAKGTINVPLHIQTQITGAISIQWRCDQNVNYTISLDNKTLNFTPSVDGVYNFTVTADDGQQAISKVIKVTVGSTTPTPTPEPTPVPQPEPTPTPAGTIWDSRVHTKLHDGKVRTITKEGAITPNGKGVECRASGSPKIVVNADGTFSLVSGSGGVNNLSIKVRSRHNEGGAGENRFGGLGVHIEKDKIGMKIEKFHNEHENSKEVSYSPSVYDGQFHTLEFEVKDGSGKIDQVVKIDGVQKLSNPKSSPPAYYLNKALYDKQSYLWLRINNSDHGRIYVYATHYNCRLIVVFKMDPSKNAIVFKDVKLVAI